MLQGTYRSGHANQTAKVRGKFVHASQVADVVKRHPELLRARLVDGKVIEDARSYR